MQLVLEVEEEVAAEQAAAAAAAADLLNPATMKSHHPATILDSMKGPNISHHNSC